MEAIFLVCGAGGPQLKRNPLGSNPSHERPKVAKFGFSGRSSENEPVEPLPLAHTHRGSLADVANYVERLVRSPGDGGTLVLQVVDAEPFLQFTGGPSGVQMCFPFITPYQKDHEHSVRRFFETRSLHMRATFGSDRSRFLDIDLPADAALVTEITLAAFDQIFDVRASADLDILCEGLGVAA